MEEKMQKDVVELIEEYIPDDPVKWGKLASELQWRRLQLMALREILIELRKLNQSSSSKMV
jgi:hypothetical protein